MPYIAVADLNGDGKPDLAVGSASYGEGDIIPGVFNILLGNGDGTFAAAVQYNTGASAPEFYGVIVAADFNGDGRADIATSIPGLNISLAQSAGPAALAITKSHTGHFTPGQTGATWTITVSNIGGSYATGAVSAADALPAGVTATAIGGTGWDCVLATLTCTRSDTLLAFDSYPPITLTVNVAANAPLLVTNTATLTSGTVTVSVGTANDPTYISNAATPAISGIENAADSSAHLAPGSMASLFGTALSSTTAQAPSTPLPTTLANNVTVSVNGRLAPIQFVSPSQVNFQIPYETSTSTPASVVVSNEGASSGPWPFQPQVSAPGIFAGVTQNADSSLNSAGNPALPGSAVTVFFTGAGPVTPAVADGATAPASPPAAPTAVIGVMIGGVSASVVATELTPGLVGVAQVTATVPASLTRGSYALVVTASSAASAPATLFVGGASAAAPVISSIAPDYVLAGSGATTVAINGSNFGAGTTVSFQSSSGAVTEISFTSSTPGQLSAIIPQSLLGTTGVAQIFVTNAEETESNELPFYITAFNITSLVPNHVTAGSPATNVTVAGIVAAPNSPTPVPTSLVFIPPGGTVATAATIAVSQSGFQWLATIPATLLNDPGTAQIALADSSGLSNLLPFTIVQPLPATTTSLSASPDPSVYGQPVQLTAAVSPSTATGRVTFYDGTTVLGTSTIASGQAVLTTRLPAAGARSLRAYYEGDANDAGSSSAVVPQTVNAVAEARLAAPVNYTSGVNSWSAAVGDFNGDGYADLAIAGGTSLTILRGNGNGSFSPGATYPLSGGNTQISIAAADFNGDGKTDLVVTDQIGTANQGGEAPSVERVFLGNGDGTFTAQDVNSGFPNSGFPAISEAVADFNGDGNPDIVMGGYGLIDVVLGNGDGTFQPGLIFGAGLAPGNDTSVAVGDFNADGYADLAVAASGPGSSGSVVTVLLGNGDGTFQTGVQYPTYNQTAYWVAAADFNGDGKLDLAVTCLNSVVNVFLGNGDGTFQPRIDVQYSGGGEALTVATSDFNGDGKPDLVLTDNVLDSVSVILGNGDGTFQPQATYNIGDRILAAAAVADFNGDGAPDIAAPNYYSGNVSILLGEPVLPDLTIAKTHVGAFGLGQTGVYTVTVSNVGFAPTTGTVTVVDALPAGLTVAAMSGTGWSCLVSTLTCTRSDPLSVSMSYQAITVTVNVAANAPPLVTNVASVSGGGEANASNDTATDVTAILEAQTISFGALSNVPINTAPFPISAMASSGQPVSFTSNTTNVCTVSEGMVTITALGGGCSITASQPGNATYAAAPPVTQAFTVLFGDVPSNTYYAAAVDVFAQDGITAGCGSDDYCPGLVVTRDQMAIFLVRAVYGSDNFTSSSTPYFTDVAPSTFGFKWIQKLYELGITKGCTATTYCPTLVVTRDDMAIFLMRLRYGLTLAANPPSFSYPMTPLFTDVPADDSAFAWIQRMKVDGITSGCTTTTYCPSLAVTRGDMALFVMRAAMNQFLPTGTPVITGISPSTLPLGSTATFTVTGTNTNFVQGTTTLGPIPGVTVGTITVTNPTSFTVQLTAAPDATAQPYSVVAITGTEDDVLPSGLTIE